MEHCKPRHPQDEIEHDKKATLEFKWMLGVCYGNSIEKGVKPEDTTCDAHKGNAELTINPFDELSVRKIKYKADGSIYSDDADINKDVAETLNLNKGKSQDAFMRELERTYEKLVQERNLIPYCGIIISWLEEKLKTS